MLMPNVGENYDNQIRCRCPKAGETWHLDEVLDTVKGEKYYLWPAVDPVGRVLDILIQSRQDKAAAKKIFNNQNL